LLVGDASKAQRVLGWQATVTFAELVKMMVDADLARQQRALRHAAAEVE
jgi:GDPmannose 4,6-dehydratase